MNVLFLRPEITIQLSHIKFRRRHQVTIKIAKSIVQVLSFHLMGHFIQT